MSTDIDGIAKIAAPQALTRCPIRRKNCKRQALIRTPPRSCLQGRTEAAPSGALAALPRVPA
jgi:hypothetical protein